VRLDFLASDDETESVSSLLGVGEGGGKVWSGLGGLGVGYGATAFSAGSST